MSISFTILIPIVGWVVAFLTTAIAVYFGRKTKPHERASHELEIIQVRNEFLEKRVEDLENQQIQHAEEIKRRDEQIAIQINNVRQLTESLNSCLSVSSELKNASEDLQNQVINAQVAASLMRNQLTEIIKRFNVPKTMR